MCKFNLTSFFTPLWLGMALLAGCAPADPPRKPWREELSIIVVRSENSAEAEMEVQLASLFAKYLQTNIKLLPFNQDQVMSALWANKAHIAAAGIRSNEKNGLHFGPSYQTLREQVVCNGRRPRHMENLLAKNIVVVKGSSQESALWEIGRAHV